MTGKFNKKNLESLLFNEMVGNESVAFLNYVQGGSNRSKCSPLGYGPDAVGVELKDFVVCS